MADKMPHVPFEHMSDRELLEEVAQNMRNVSDALEALSENPMIAAIASGQNPMLAMMGR